ncbi:uncharacterized protein LOC143600592 [Bidens hawaiensis]|uniref:uncharacterized protein LOC143600592 n=1 Tax=Bidens hawaiensis TaxID=980011 RepID=UPI00404970FD
MAQNEAATVDPTTGGSFSRLLFSGLEPEDTITLNHHPNNTTVFTFSSDKKTPKMLSFGPDSKHPQNPNTTAGDDNNNNNSSSPMTITTTTTNSLSSNSSIKKIMGCDYYQPVVVPTTCLATALPVKTTGRSNKKTRTENSAPPASHAKVKKKEKLGERIAALQQLVSPYGKSDTASVLHEAMGYIKFLQEQVHVLCSPYLQRLPPAQNVGEEGGVGERKKDLRIRGLCLVPVDCTLQVAETNGADMWSPAMVNRHGSSALHQ